jgi:hypothetical protein
MKEFFSKIPAIWIRRIILWLLIILFIVKILAGSCQLWICGLFVALIIAFMILSDYGKA